jgi:hypothetical protein
MNVINVFDTDQECLYEVGQKLVCFRTYRDYTVGKVYEVERIGLSMRFDHESNIISEKTIGLRDDKTHIWNYEQDIIKVYFMSIAEYRKEKIKELFR